MAENCENSPQKFPETKVMSSKYLFCWTNRPNGKVIQFVVKLKNSQAKILTFD